MEYDYDYYDDEMGVAGVVGLLDSDDAGGTDYEPHDPTIAVVSDATGIDALSDYAALPSPPSKADSSETSAVRVDIGKEGGVTTDIGGVEDNAVDDMVSKGNDDDSLHNEPASISDSTPSSIEDTKALDAAKDFPKSIDPASITFDRYAEIMDSPTPPAVATSRPSPNVVEFMAESSDGNGKMTQIDILTSKSESIKNTIYKENKGKKFNVNSPKQVARVLFGDSSESTNRDVLDALASAGNRMADLILQYREVQRDLKRANKQVENKANGIHVDDFHKSSPGQARAAALASAAARHKGDDYEEMLEFDDANGSNPLLLVDASAYIFRAYYSMPPLHRADGTPVGALVGFCNMLNRLVLNRLLAGGQPRIVLVFDAKGKTFRHEMYPEYKANRSPCPVDLVPQFDLIRDAARAYGIDQIEAPTYEADDVIATLARMAREEGVNVHVLSGDKDLMQLVTPADAVPSVNMIDPKEMVRVTADVVTDKWGVPPALLGDVLALAGDSSDNIPGVPGIGPKIARDLINEYGSLETVLERAEEIKQKARRTKLIENAEMAILSRKLVELDAAVPLEAMTMPDHYTSVSELKMASFSSKKLLTFYEENGLQDLAFRLKRRLPGDDTSRSATNNSSNAATSAGSQAGLDDVKGDEVETEVSSVNQDNSVEENVPNVALNENIRRGLIMHNRRRQAPPDPEDFSDVPF